MKRLAISQYLQPDGRVKQIHTEVDEEIFELSLDIILSAEVLSPGTIAFYARYIHQGKEDEIMDIAVNGPGENSPQKVLTKLIKSLGEKNGKDSNLPQK